MNKCSSTSPTPSTRIEKETDGQIAFRYGEYMTDDKFDQLASVLKSDLDSQE